MESKRDELTARNFPSAEEDAQAIVTPSPYSGPESAYRLAFTDTDFLLREELRPVRMQLELFKPEMIQQAYDIRTTIVIFGSARMASRRKRRCARRRLCATRRCAAARSRSAAHPLPRPGRRGPPKRKAAVAEDCATPRRLLRPRPRPNPRGSPRRRTARFGARPRTCTRCWAT